MKNLHWVALTSLLLIGACGEVDEPGTDAAADSQHDSFLGADGKADGFGPAEGSPEALGVLEVVNTLDERGLDRDVRLDRRAAANIVAVRVGPDGQLFTDDDSTIATLAELDTISWVGPRAFGKLLTFAHDFGYIGSGDVIVHGIVEGSEDAQIILDVANTLSYDQLNDDVRLDRRAARAIVDTRASGPIPSLTELDQVHYVASRAFNKLLDYGRNNSLVNLKKCSEEYPTNQFGNFRIDSYQDLLAFEEADCGIVDGDMVVRFVDGFVSSSRRNLESLASVHTVEGSLSITVSLDVIDTIDLPNLKVAEGGVYLKKYSTRGSDFRPLKAYLDGLVDTAIVSGRLAYVSLDSLERAGSISITYVDGGSSLRVPSLLSIDHIKVSHQGARSSFSIEAPLVTSIESLEIPGMGYAFDADFSSLESAKNLSFRSMRLTGTGFPNLTEVTESLRFGGVRDPLVVFPSLTTVGQDLALENVRFSQTDTHHGPDSLREIGGSLIIKHEDVSITGYANLDSVSTIEIEASRCEEISAFSSVEVLDSLVVKTGYCSLTGFQNLREVSGDVYMVVTTQPWKPITIGMDSLVSVGGDVFFWNSHAEGTLDVLETVGGSFEYRSSEGFKGFNALKTVGKLQLLGAASHRASREILGLHDLNAVGSSLIFSSRIDRRDVDRVVDQLQSIGGEVRFVDY